MARPIGSTSSDKAHKEALAAQWMAGKKRTLRELRMAAGRTQKVTVTPDGKIKERWI